MGADGGSVDDFRVFFVQQGDKGIVGLKEVSQMFDEVVIEILTDLSRNGLGNIFDGFFGSFALADVAD